MICFAKKTQTRKKQSKANARRRGLGGPQTSSIEHITYFGNVILRPELTEDLLLALNISCTFFSVTRRSRSDESHLLTESLTY